MDLGWAAVFQAILIAGSTWYVRRGSQQDAKRVEDVTASQGTASEILTRVKHLEDDMALVKRIVFKEASIDNRGPKRGA